MAEFRIVIAPELQEHDKELDARAERFGGKVIPPARLTGRAAVAHEWLLSTTPGLSHHEAVSCALECLSSLITAKRAGYNLLLCHPRGDRLPVDIALTKAPDIPQA
jgi:hypothetical protein